MNLWEGFLGTYLRKIVEDEDLGFINWDFGMQREFWIFWVWFYEFSKFCLRRTKSGFFYIIIIIMFLLLLCSLDFVVLVKNLENKIFGFFVLVFMNVVLMLYIHVCFCICICF
jgi:hypothetical protein